MASNQHAVPCCACRHCQDELEDVKNFNFDHPDAFDTPALLECVDGLKQGRSVNVPTYDFSQHKRGTETKRVSSIQAFDSLGGPWYRASLFPSLYVSLRMVPVWQAHVRCVCFSAAAALWSEGMTTMLRFLDIYVCWQRMMWLCAAVVLQVDPAKVIILEGILVLHIPELREQCSMRIYVDTG